MASKLTLVGEMKTPPHMTLMFQVLNSTLGKFK